MGSSLSGDLFGLGFGFGAGLGVASGPFIILSMLADNWLERRRVNKIRSKRRPPSVVADTVIIPAVKD